jgi:hypothetical protein
MVIFWVISENSCVRNPDRKYRISLFNLSRRHIMLRKLVVVTFFMVFVNTSYGSPVWPMHAGKIWEYTAYPTDGSASWIELWRFGEEVILDSKLYFPVRDTYFRSTDDKIYEWEPVLGETVFFQVAPIGTTWNHSTNNTVEILDNNTPVEGVYGGPYEAYKLKFTDPDGTWYVYVVPNVGIVQWDEFDADPNYVLKLTNVGNQAQEGLLVWPLSEGRIWTYHCQDSNGTEWIETREVIDSNVLGGQIYYKVHVIEDCPYDYDEFDIYIRSTDKALYIWEDGNERMDFVVGPVGFGLIVDPNTVREIVSKDLITVPYGGPYEVYSYGKRWNVEIDPYLIESFVPGLGFIKMVDYWATYPPVIKELISISPDHLCGDYGHPYPVGDENHDCIVNFKDLSIIAAHWLECTRFECVEYGYSGMYDPDLSGFEGIFILSKQEMMP